VVLVWFERVQLTRLQAEAAVAENPRAGLGFLLDVRSGPGDAAVTECPRTEGEVRALQRTRAANAIGDQSMGLVGTWEGSYRALGRITLTLDAAGSPHAP
jgi:hypothetical protein